ncbi:MAG TPA: hypothetical protein VMJ11_06640 [Paraburkholderia sp.]|uniref:hypothetical protein n=1 Tax=Paraburkholderia sp. TaxID=1926495 RepID=UPI002B51A6BB|nr:hypothetical protein [Paraburkholderia sp.]HTR06325.1 hypothetical protein [Paraburkholderia sp.]
MSLSAVVDRYHGKGGGLARELANWQQTIAAELLTSVEHILPAVNSYISVADRCYQSGVQTEKQFVAVIGQEDTLLTIYTTLI